MLCCKGGIKNARKKKDSKTCTKTIEIKNAAFSTYINATCMTCAIAIRLEMGKYSLKIFENHTF